MNGDQSELNSQAVALYYDGETAPVVTAKGKGHVAEEIIRIANENDVPIKEQAELAYFLSKVELGEEIPEMLYLAAAEVIAFAYMLKHKVPDSFQKKYDLDNDHVID